MKITIDTVKKHILESIKDVQRNNRSSRRSDLGITTNSPIYNKFLLKWQKCRDAVAGEDEIKFKGKIYLPRPSGMDDEDYDSYKGRAQFFNPKP